VPDKTESKLRQCALRRNGDPITNKDIVELMFALDDDGVARHVETMNIVVPLRDDFLEHCQSEDERLKMIVEGEHAKRHGEHMAVEHARRADDPPYSDFTEDRSDEEQQREWQHRLAAFTGTVFGKVALLACGAGVGMLLSYIFTGTP
jgi:hypothetical protein